MNGEYLVFVINKALTMMYYLFSSSLVFPAQVFNFTTDEFYIFFIYSET